MKIAMIGQKGIPAHYGGIERHVEELAKGLVNLGQEVFVYARPWFAQDKQCDSVDGVKIIYTPSIKTKHFDAISHTFISLLHAVRQDFDVIHIHGVGPALMAWLPKLLKRNVQVVVTFHCIDRKHQKWGRLARLALRLGEWMACRFSDRTITVSRTLQQYCSEAYDSMTFYIPNGIKEIPCHGHDEIKKFGLEPDNYIVAVSRLVPHKGMHYLIQAYKKLKSSGAIGTKKLAIVGGSAFTDKYIKELKSLAQHDQDIIFTDYQSGDTLWQLYKNAYLYVHPSESEGLPTTILEAMSWGLPVLASDIPENMEAVENHGLSFQNKNVEDLARQMEIYLPQADYLKSLGRGAKQHVYANYNWPDIAKEVLGLYFDLKPESKFNQTAFQYHN